MDDFQTVRLLLRRRRKDDLGASTRICADPEVIRHIGGGRPAHLIPERGADLQVHRHWDERGFGLWAVEHGGSSKFIDFVGLVH